MKKQRHIKRSGKSTATICLLELLKERSGNRLTKIEAYLDLVNKASVQYIPKDLCKQDFTLSDGQFVVTITELSECWHWHRATVRTFMEQLENLGQLCIDRLTKSQVITIPFLIAAPQASQFGQALKDFRHTMDEALSDWRNGKMSVPACASLCEQLYENAVERYAASRSKAESGKALGNLPQLQNHYEQAFCTIVLACICKATFQRAMMNSDTSERNSLLRFFEEDLAFDWESFIEATKVLTGLTMEGNSVQLAHESEAMKSQFQSLCKPFLLLLTEKTVPSEIDTEKD